MLCYHFVMSELILRVGKAIADFNDSDNDHVRSVGTTAFGMLREKLLNIQLYDSAAEPNFPYTRLVWDQSVGLVATVVVSSEGLSADFGAWQSDLLRSLFLYDQSLIVTAVKDPIYTLRYRDSMLQALDFQEKWLTKSGITAQLLHDPRTQERNALLPHLLGEAMFLSDFGMDDWQLAVDRYIDGTTRPSTASPLKAAAMDPVKFCTARAVGLLGIHEFAIKLLGRNVYNKIPPLVRAMFCADTLTKQYALELLRDEDKQYESN